MKGFDRVIDIIEDHKGLTDYVLFMCLWLDGTIDDKPMVPQLNDSLMMDLLSKIGDNLKK